MDQVLSWPEGSRIQVLAPVVRSRKGEHVKVFEDARKGGYVHVRVDGSVYDLSEIKLEKNKKHNVEVVVDRLVVRPDSARERLTDSIETAASLAGGLVLIDCPSEGREQLFSQNYACGLRRLHRGADAEDVLLQQPLRRLPDLRRPGRPAAGRTPACSSRTRALHPQGGLQAPAGPM